MIKKLLFAALVTLALGVASQAQTIDGTLDGSYGSAIAVQDTPTGFGDNTLGLANSANGSELDAAYATISGGNLNLFLAGNLESNNNGMYILFDTGSGGQNTISGQTGTAAGINGMKLDAGFSPAFAIIANGNTTNTFFDFANLNTAAVTFLGSSVPGSGSGTLTTGTANGVSAALNNSNTAGVTGSSGTGGGSVTTGLELQIPLALLGNPTGNINVSAFITGNPNTAPAFVSNQFLAGTGGAANLGNANTVDMTTVAGNQFFTVSAAAVPEPATVLLIGPALLGGMFFVRRRRA